MAKFNVFGKIMSVYKEYNQWLLYIESDTSIRRRVYDVVIPNDLSESQLSSYLGDIFHEWASEKYPTVIPLEVTQLD